MRCGRSWVVSENEARLFHRSWRILLLSLSKFISVEASEVCNSLPWWFVLWIYPKVDGLYVGDAWDPPTLPVGKRGLVRPSLWALPRVRDIK